MFKITTFYIFLAYLIPLSFAVSGQYYLEYIQVIILFTSFFLGAIICKSILKEESAVDYSIYLKSNNVQLYIVACVYFLLRLDLIIELTTVLSKGDFTRWSLERAIARYDNTQTISIMDQFGTIFFFSYSVLLGSSNFKRSSLLPLFLYLFMIFLESSALARAGVLLGVTIVFIELLIRNNSLANSLSSFKLAKIAIVGILFLLLIFIFSAYFRIASSDNPIIATLTDKFLIYTVAQYEALFFWISETQELGTDYGFNTLTALYKLFGIPVKQGFYLPVNTSFGVTNIYTNLRGLLADYGLLFSSLIMMIMGFTVYLYTYKKTAILGYFFLRAILFYLFFMLISPFTFTTVFIGFNFAYMLLILRK